MSWFGQSKRPEGPPKCFGKSWDTGASECAGGADPAYSEEKIDTKTGEKYISHIREQCGYFNECGSRTQASKMQQVSQQLVPTTSLTRAWTGRPTPTASSPQPSAQAQPQQAVQQFGLQQLQQQFVQMQQQFMQQQMEMMRRGQIPQGMMMPPQMMPGMMPGPQMGFQQMMPVNFEIPQYLTRREHRRPDESLFRMLGREVARSMLKSAGHTFANFWDSTPFILEPPKE